jgi:hypothetical protein
MRTRSLIAAALGTALALGSAIPSGLHGSAYAAPSLSSIVLKKSEVPAGYRLTSGKADTAQSQAKSAHVSVATLLGKGWLGSYMETFEKGNSATDIQIYSSVDQFKSVGGVNWDISNGVSVIKKQLSNVKVFSLSGIGQQTLGLTASGTLQKVRYAALYVVFRRGTYLGAVGIIIAGKFTAAPALAQAERYAAIMDGRLKNG